MAATTNEIVNEKAAADIQPMRWEGSSLIDWGDPIPLDPQHGPDLPPEYLPDSIRPFVEAVANSFQLPLGMPACLALGTISIAVGGKFQISIKDWHEPVHGHFVVAAEPGEMKSGAHKAVSFPLSEWEAQRNEEERVQVNEWESRNRELESSLKRAETSSKKQSGDGYLAHEGDRITALQELEEHAQKRKTYTTLTVDNCTPEQAAALLFANGGALGVSSAEGTFIEGQLFGYKPQPDLEILLKGHAGDPMRTDRSTSVGGRTDRACLSLSVCLQPQAIREAGKVKGFSGKGAAQRLLICFPKSMAGHRDVLDSPQIPSDLREHWRAQINDLLDIPRTAEPTQLEVSTGAMAVLRAFMEEHEKSLRGLTGGYKGWVSKQRGAVLRLAGLFHLMEATPNDQITARTMATAIAMSWWFRQHAQLMFRLLSDDVSHSAGTEVLDWIVSSGKHSLTAREIHQGLRGRVRFREVRAVREALDLLDLHNFVEVIEDKGAVGRSSIHVTVHPQVVPRANDGGQEVSMADEWDDRFATFNLEEFLNEHDANEDDDLDWIGDLADSLEGGPSEVAEEGGLDQADAWLD